MVSKSGGAYSKKEVFVTEEQQYPNYMGQPLGNKGSGVSLFCLLAAGAFGAGVAMLFAPKRGNHFRHKLGERTKKRIDETLLRAHRMKERSGRVGQTITDKSHKIDGPAETFSANDLAARSTSNAVKSSIRGEYGSKRRLARKNAGCIRKSSSIV